MLFGSPIAFRKSASFVFLAAATLALVGTSRMYFDGKRHYEAASSLLRQGNLWGALTEFEDSAKAYFPGNPYNKRSIDSIELMGKAAKIRGDTELAKASFESMRRSILATRHVVIPHSRELDRANRLILSLAEQKKGDKPHTEMVTIPNDPSSVASLFLFFGLFLWASGAIALCFLPDRNRLFGVPSTALALSSSIAGLGLWIFMAFLA